MLEESTDIRLEIGTRRSSFWEDKSIKLKEDALLIEHYDVFHNAIETSKPFSKTYHQKTTQKSQS